MILVVNDIHKGFSEGEDRWLKVIEGLSLEIEKGGFIAITGESGVGKSTLLHILGLLDTPDSGDVVFDGMNIAGLSDAKRAEIRSSGIGFVFQFHHLLPEFDARENVAIPMRIAGLSETEALNRASLLLEKVGLENRSKHFPNALSGGEQQRVALARALACKPSLLLADEPTGNLDARNSDRLVELLFSLTKQENMAVVLATHNRELAGKAEKIYCMENGTLSNITGDFGIRKIG